VHPGATLELHFLRAVTNRHFLLNLRLLKVERGDRQVLLSFFQFNLNSIATLFFYEQEQEKRISLYFSLD